MILKDLGRDQSLHSGKVKFGVATPFRVMASALQGDCSKGRCDAGTAVMGPPFSSNWQESPPLLEKYVSSKEPKNLFRFPGGELFFPVGLAPGAGHLLPCLSCFSWPGNLALAAFLRRNCSIAPGISSACKNLWCLPCRSQAPPMSRPCSSNRCSPTTAVRVTLLTARG